MKEELESSFFQYEADEGRGIELERAQNFGT